MNFVLPTPVMNALSRLEQAGFSAYAVGGCVRDHVLGMTPHDYDICTSATPEEMQRVFQGERTIETGVKHGTLTVLLNKMPLEITTFRVDGAYSDGRHPDSVRFTARVEDDLSRRDFTINAMAADEDNVIDYYGGQVDLKAGIIRAVGDPYVRFEEDSLRILRAIRFASRLNFEVEEKTREAIMARREDLKYISSERIYKEFAEILCSERVDYYLQQYAEVFAVFMPELARMFDFPQNNRYHIYDLWQHSLKVTASVSPKIALRWAALLHDIGKVDTLSHGEDGQDHYYGHAAVSAKIARQILQRLKCDRKTENEVIALIRNHEQLPKARRLLNKMGDYSLDLIELKKADNQAQNPLYDESEKYDQLKAEVLELIASQSAVSIKDLKINGNDLRALGYEGKAIGDKLNEVMERVLDGYPNDRDELLKLIKRG